MVVWRRAASAPGKSVLGFQPPAEAHRKFRQELSGISGRVELCNRFDLIAWPGLARSFFDPIIRSPIPYMTNSEKHYTGRMSLIGRWLKRINDRPMIEPSLASGSFLKIHGESRRLSLHDPEGIFPGGLGFAGIPDSA